MALRSCASRHALHRAATQLDTRRRCRAGIPVTDRFSPKNAQEIQPLNPAVGIPGNSNGIPGYQPMPDLVPLVAGNGRGGYVDQPSSPTRHGPGSPTT